MRKRSAVRSALSGVAALLSVLAGSALVSPAVQAAPVQANPTVQAEPAIDTQPSGMGPTQIQAAYGLSTSPYAGIGQTIAIVDAFDNPNVAVDLNTFDAFLGLPVCDATCFTKVDQNGGTDYPAQGSLN